MAKYPEKNWKLDTVKLICKRVDETGSALTRKPGGGRPRSVRTPEMIEQVGQLICSQENQPGTNKSTRKIAEQLNIHRSSVQRIVRRIVRRDLQLSAFRRVPAQIISESVKQKRHERCKKLIRHIPVKFAKKVFLLMKKTFTRMFLLTIEMTCLVRWQEARRRQKAPNAVVITEIKLKQN